MNKIQAICATIVISPFYVLGLFMHFCMTGYIMSGPFFFKIMGYKPKQEFGGAIVASREEFEAFTEVYRSKNPNATPDDAVRAFIQSKQ